MQSGSTTTVQIKELSNTTYSATSSDAKTTVSVSGGVITINAGSYTTSTPVNITVTGAETEDDRTFTKTLTFQLTVLALGATTMRLKADTKAIHIRTSPAKIWGKGRMMYEMAKDRIKHALSLNSANKFLGLVWCQGENDGIAQLDSSTYKSKLQEFVSHINTNLSSAKMFNGRKFSFRTDVIGFKSCKYWVNRANCTYGSVVVPAQREFFGSNYVEFDDDATFDTNATNGTGKMTSAKASHYGNDVYRRRIVPAIMDKVKNNYGNKITIK